ncbi:MAG: hypothetical protein ACYCPS_04655 [Candidatus Saccharimonadales bacterium]
MDYKVLLAILAVAIGTAGYVPYFINIKRGNTKPHAFSWLVWGVLTAIAFAGQLNGHGGAGAWVTGFTALVCFTIFSISLIRGTRVFPLIDWLCLGGCLLALVLWGVTKDALTAIVLVTIIDMIGFFPTFRKSYLNPHSETSITYFLSGSKFLISILALNLYSTTTVLYPASLVVTNIGFVLMIEIRRKQLAVRTS